MATLTKKGDWYSVQFYDPARTPQRKKRPLKTRTKREAERLLLTLEDAYASGAFDPWRQSVQDFLYGPETPADEETSIVDLSTLASAVAAFLEAKGRFREKTVAHYEGILGLFVRHAGADLSPEKITARHILAFLDSTRCNATSRRNYCFRIGVFMRWLREQGARVEDVSKRVPLERPPDKFASKLISGEQLERIVRAAEESSTPYVADVARVAYGLALRLGEVCAMRRGWVDLENRRLTIRQGGGFLTKNGKDLSKPIPQDALEVLTRRCRDVDDPDALVFRNSRGNALNLKWTSKRFKKIVRSLGMPESITFHGLRHGGISRVVAGGANIEAARRFAGHSSIEMTMRYAHLLDSQYEAQVLLALGG